MPWTLYRYILKDLIRLLLMATLALVSVVSFAVALKPLSDGLLSAMALPRYIGYMTPLILVLVLPFAAAFAGTMVFNRLANDNEILACRASGMSYSVIILPIAVLGMALMLTLYLLSNYVVPRFYLTAEKMLQVDMTRMLVKQIEKRQPLKLGDGIVVFADAADDTQPPPVFEGSQVQPTRRIVLQGVAVGRMDDRGVVRSDSTAETADVLVWDVGDSTWVTMGLQNVMHYDAATGATAQGSLQVPAIELPSAFTERTMFLSLKQLRRLRTEPGRYKDVREKKLGLVQALAAQWLIDQLDTSLQQSARQGVELIGPTGERYRVYAPMVVRTTPEPQRRGDRIVAAEPDRLTLRRGADLTPVRVERWSGPEIVRQTEAAEATVEVEYGRPDPELRVAMTLRDVHEFDPGFSERSTEHRERVLPPMRWPQPAVAQFADLSVFDVLTLSAGAAHPAVDRAADLLRTGVARLERRIISEVTMRAATAVNCLLILLLSAALALHARGSMPLVVYFWVFLLAFIATLAIRSGDNVSGDLRWPLAVGISVIWAGNAALAAVLGVVYFKLTRT